MRLFLANRGVWESGWWLGPTVGVADGGLLVSSSLAWLEDWRALRRAGVPDIATVAELALSGVAEFPLDEVVLLRARRVGQDQLRSLDAMHLAAAIAVGADALLTYDERLASSAQAVGLDVLAPGARVIPTRSYLPLARCLVRHRRAHAAQATDFARRGVIVGSARRSWRRRICCARRAPSGGRHWSGVRTLEVDPICARCSRGQRGPT